jgi:hypothetical protein
MVEEAKDGKKLVRSSWAMKSACASGAAYSEALDGKELKAMRRGAREESGNK